MLLGLGLAAGIPLALAAGRQFSSILYGLEASSATTLAGAAALLVTVSLIGAGLPAARAMRIDPVETLREQ